MPSPRSTCTRAHMHVLMPECTDPYNRFHTSACLPGAPCALCAFCNRTHMYSHHQVTYPILTSQGRLPQQHWPTGLLL